MYIVVIEWDGMKPPTTYYHRLRKLAFRVRGNKDKSPIARRSSEDDHGVIMQEGAIMTHSESLARTIAYLARHHGASFVAVGTINLETDFVPSQDDVETFHRIENAFGKRGRPETDKIDWAVLCIEEAKMYEVKDVARVAVCPSCMATNIKARPGKINYMKMPSKSTLEDAWVRTRFSTGVFEPAVIVDDSTYPYPPKLAAIKYKNEQEAKTVKLIVESKPFIRDLNSIQSITKKPNNATSLRLMDAVFISREYYPVEKRQRNRVIAATEMFKANVDPSLVKLLEDDKQVDLLDMASNIAPEAVANYWVLAQSHA